MHITLLPLAVLVTWWKLTLRSIRPAPTVILLLEDNGPDHAAMGESS